MFVKGKCWVFKGNAAKNSQNPCSCFGYRLSYNNLNEVMLISKEPYEIGLKIYKRNQEKILALRLPKMGLKVSSGSSWVCSVLGVVMMF